MLLDATDLYIGHPLPLRPTQTGDKGRGQIIAHVRFKPIAQNCPKCQQQWLPALQLTGNTSFRLNFIRCLYAINTTLHSNNPLKICQADFSCILSLSLCICVFIFVFFSLPYILLSLQRDVQPSAHFCPKTEVKVK